MVGRLLLCLLLAGTLPVAAQDLSTWEKANQAMKVCVLNEFAASTDSLYQFAKSLVDSRLNEDGSVIQDFVKGDLEQMVMGNLFNALYTHTQEERYKKATNWLHHYLVMGYPRNKKTTAQNTFIYKEQEANRMRLDGLYWAVTYFAGWVSTFDPRNTQAWSDIADQFMLLNKQTHNSVTGLNYSLWTSDPDNEEMEGLVLDGVFKGCLPEYSALSMAHLFAAAVDVLAVIPKEQPDHVVLSLLVNQVAGGLLNWQDEATGQWTKTVAYQEGEELEFDAEASDLIAASYLKALRIAALKDTDYKAFALKTYELAKARGCSALLTAEHDAYQKALAAAKPAAKAPVRRTTPVKK